MDFEQIITKIKSSKKYRFLCEDTIRNVLKEEMQVAVGSIKVAAGLRMGERRYPLLRAMFKRLR